MRRDLQPLRPGSDIAVELRILTQPTHRFGDRSHPGDQPPARPAAGILPRAGTRIRLHSASKAALILLSGYQTPDGLRHAGAARLAAWLRKREARNADGRQQLRRSRRPNPSTPWYAGATTGGGDGGPAGRGGDDPRHRNRRHRRDDRGAISPAPPRPKSSLRHARLRRYPRRRVPGRHGRGHRAAFAPPPTASPAVAGLAPVPARLRDASAATLKRPPGAKRPTAAARLLPLGISHRHPHRHRSIARPTTTSKCAHEALDVRGEVEDLRRLAVAAAELKLGAA